MRPRTTTKPRREVTCDDCYFRREGLCAIPGDSVCPTFRSVHAGALAPPPQPRLVPRPLTVAAGPRVA